MTTWFSYPDEYDIAVISSSFPGQDVFTCVSDYYLVRGKCFIKSLLLTFKIFMLSSADSLWYSLHYYNIEMQAVAAAQWQWAWLACKGFCFNIWSLALCKGPQTRQGSEWGLSFLSWNGSCKNAPSIFSSLQCCAFASQLKVCVAMWFLSWWRILSDRVIGVDSLL